MSTHELSAGEAELIRLARLGADDTSARASAIHALQALWPTDGDASHRSLRGVILAAVGAALTVKLPAVLGIELSADAYLVNVGLWVLAWAIAMFAAGARWGQRTWAQAGVALISLLVLVNVIPDTIPDGGTSSALALTATHLPIALWFALGAVRARQSWRDNGARLDFVRFSGEAFFYYALLALAGGVLMALSYQMFASVSTAADSVIGGWIAPLGAAAGVVVAAWLADSAERIMGRIAVIVQRVFTPLFALVMAVFTVTAVPGGFFNSFRRDELTVYDALLVVVTALAMYGVASQSARPVSRIHDTSLLAMMATGITVDLLIVVAMVNRAVDFGLSANRVAATGLNLVLLANLAGLAVRQWRRVRGSDAGAPAQWAATYLPVLAGWAAFVALALPLLFWGK